MSASLPASTAGDDAITLYGPSGEDLMVVQGIVQEGTDVVVKGRAYGTMPLAARLTPEQARRIVKMLGLSIFPLLFKLLFGRSKPKSGAPSSPP